MHCWMYEFSMYAFSDLFGLFAIEAVRPCMAGVVDNCFLADGAACKRFYLQPGYLFESGAKKRPPASRLKRGTDGLLFSYAVLPRDNPGPQAYAFRAAQRPAPWLV